jgi:hypothetical protein
MQKFVVAIVSHTSKSSRQHVEACAHTSFLFQDSFDVVNVASLLNSNTKTDELSAIGTPRLNPSKTLILALHTKGASACSENAHVPAAPSHCAMVLDDIEGVFPLVYVHSKGRHRCLLRSW